MTDEQPQAIGSGAGSTVHQHDWTPDEDLMGYWCDGCQQTPLDALEAAQDSNAILNTALEQCAEANQDYERRLEAAQRERDYFEREVEAEHDLNRLAMARIAALTRALRQILDDPDGRILDSYRDDGWGAIAGIAEAAEQPDKP